MELILLKNVEKVGRKFEIVQVKNGYGRNYLIPQGLAVIANKTNRNNLESYKRQESAKLEKLLDTFKEVADKVKGQTLNIPVKCGTTGKIFGSVTTLQISKALKEQLDVDVDRRDIILPDDVKTIGTYTAELDLHPNVEATVDFHLEPDDPKVAAAIAEAQEKEEAEAARKAEADAAKAEQEAAEKAEAASAPAEATEEEAAGEEEAPAEAEEATVEATETEDTEEK